MISDENWESIVNIKTQFRCRSMNDVITLLIDNFYDEERKTSHNALKPQKTTSQNHDETKRSEGEKNKV